MPLQRLVDQSGLAAATAAELDELGRLSGVAQGLAGPITSCEKVAAAAAAGQGQQLVLYVDEEGRALGYIKWGRKESLYFYRKNGSMVQCSPVCVLDFYVHETLQRRGVGLELFEAMLLELGGVAAPHLLAYDRPSPKLLGFMRKHYGLARPDLQPNRFCIFENFPLD